MVIKVVIAVIAVLAIVSSGLAADNQTVPAVGFVPDAETAIGIAEAVWTPIYGKELIASEKPFKATLKGDVWIVTGAELPTGSLGGVVEAHISKRDGRILRVVHEQ